MILRIDRMKWPKLSSETKGPGEKGAPRNHPEISSQKLAGFECRFPPSRLLWKGQSTILALFRRRILGQYHASQKSVSQVFFPGAPN